MLDASTIWILVPLAALFVPISAIFMGHRQKLAELKFRAHQQGDQRVLDEIAGLRRELTELRDTATKYDMSFDSALQRMETRMGAVEQRMAAVEQGSSAVAQR